MSKSAKRPAYHGLYLAGGLQAHASPVPTYKIRSDHKALGGVATWLSHHVMKAGTRSRDRLAAVMRLSGQEPPRALWREVAGREDELRAVWDLPRASTIDHFWSVVRCAEAYGMDRLLQGEGRSLWVDLLILSAERDTQWPATMFEAFWEMVQDSACPHARWCEFPGDDHLDIARYPVKYYKEIKDFLIETGATGP